RPVEWLSDQKYNAWNYGINFTDWKAHLKWAGVLSLLEIALCFGISLFSPSFYRGFISIQFFIVMSVIGTPKFFPLFCIELILGASFVWLIWGYLFFGSSQGLSKILSSILIGLIIFIPIITALLSQGILITIGMLLSATIIPLFFFLLIYILSFVGCWKTKSIAPMLYSMFFLVLVAFIVTISVAKLGLPIFPQN
ncbi:MAG: hypothetical protein ABI210_12155, partial [Abditibacteriaceae bacterium]